MEESWLCQWSVFRSLLAILQWWGFNVTVIVMNKWIFQVAVAVLVSWMIFKNPIPALNAVGCGITLLGCTFYGYVRHLISQQLPGTPRTPRTPRGRMELLPLVNDKLDDKV